MLSRDREFIVLYRGKDFLPSAVSSAIEERRRHEKRIGEFAEGDMLRNKEVGETKDQKGTLHSVSSQISSPEAVIKRTSTKLSMVYLHCGAIISCHLPDLILSLICFSL